LGYPDHLAQVLEVSVNVPHYIYDEIITRRFSKYKVAKFNDMLNSDSWEGIYSVNNLNESHLFLNRFLGYFRRAFPMKKI
jgi:hypothetical protein